MAKEEEKEVFYVGLVEAVPVRRGILESSKLIIQSLQQYDKFNGVRKQKKELIEVLKNILSDCSKEVGRLKKQLPTLKGYTPPIPQMIPPVKKSDPVTVEPAVHKISHKEMSELAKLEHELTAIESRLSNI